MTGVMLAVKCKELTVEVGVRSRANAKRAARAFPQQVGAESIGVQLGRTDEQARLREYRKSPDLPCAAVMAIMMIKET